jgi:hypothetical protein
MPPAGRRLGLSGAVVDLPVVFCFFFFMAVTRFESLQQRQALA